MFELLELYLITKNYLKFDELFSNLNLDLTELDKSDNLIIWYLKVARQFFEGNVARGKELINEAVTYIKSNPNVTNYRLWSFAEMMKSDLYKAFEMTGDQKVCIDNFIAYIQNTMPNENKEKFEKGNHRLDSVIKQNIAG